jgi:BirA family biotin operon repressor/biotin-[acetyl-CoA-carboxylase] ligase
MKDLSKIRDALGDRLFGGRVHVFATLDSTNDTAMVLGREGAPEGTLVLAEEQTHGKGRLGRKWDSRRGLGLWFSVVLRPAIDVRRSSGLSLVGAVAVASALREGYGLAAGVKWPNDVMVGARKICGILAESAVTGDALDFAVLGLGINVLHSELDFPEDLRAGATSVRIETGRAVARLQVLAGVMAALESKYLAFKSQGFAGTRLELLEISSLIGKSVRVATGRDELEGTAVDIDENGALVLRTAGGELCRLWAGDVVGIA